MMIDLNEARVRTLEQVRQVLAGPQALEVQATADDAGRYAWIESVLRRFEYRRLPRSERGPVLACLQRLSGYSRTQITRLVVGCKVSGLEQLPHFDLARAAELVRPASTWSAGST